MKNTLKATIVGGAGIVAIAVFSVAAHSPEPKEAVSAARVERGEYLVTALGCDHCHAPKKMTEHGPVRDESRYLSGFPEGAALPPAPAVGDGPWTTVATWDLTAWSGPWGVSFGINLTPDENTGIGSWSEETFVNALKTGRHMGVSRPILPPMPWESFSKLTDEDLKSIYAYLMTQPPIHNRVPEPLPPAMSAVAAGS